MNHREIVIAPQQEGKSRSFSASCLTLVEADALWEGGATDTDNVRPVHVSFAGSEAELRPFVMNLLSGRKAAFTQKDHSYRKKEDRLEVLKSSGFKVTWQKEAEGTIATLFLPELFELEPGMVDPAGAKFIVLPTDTWAAQQRVEVGPIVQHVRAMLPEKAREAEALSEEALAKLVPTAFLFVAYLDRRTRCPILQDGRFYLQLLIACLGQGLASYPNSGHHYGSPPFGEASRLGFRVERAETLGYSRGVAFSANHAQIEQVLAEQVSLFFEHV